LDTVKQLFANSKLPQNAVVTGFDFSTGSVKGIAFDLEGNQLAEVRLGTDLWTEGGVSELNIALLEGQVHSALRGMVAILRQINRINDWKAIGISATHHTCGRIDKDLLPVRRAICWNDGTLAPYHAKGLERLGGQAKVRELIGGPWAVRYSLSHLLKDEATLREADWKRTWRILPHGTLVSGFMTGNFDKISISSAASTGMMDLRSCQWQPKMLDCLENAEHRQMVQEQLPTIVKGNEPIGPLASWISQGLGIDPAKAPIVYPTSDDQQAGLVGGGAMLPGQVAIILGNSAVVNASADKPPATDELDCMRLSWGPYLWMRCYTNGAQFLDRVVGANPDWAELEAKARLVPAGCNGYKVRPFVHAEPSIGVTQPDFGWEPSEPTDPGIRFRASLEALANLVALGVQAHERNGQAITQITVSGGISKSDLMVEILEKTLGRKVLRLPVAEGSALGAAVVAVGGL
jgi:sugar (pentulose or hexulose) kinase